MRLGGEARRQAAALVECHDVVERIGILVEMCKPQLLAAEAEAEEVITSLP
jgi:hypothetical protein